MKVGFAVAGGLLAALIAWMVSCGGGDEKPDLNLGAWNTCHQFVEDRLKAPATADFEEYYQAEIRTSDGTTFTVAGHVDAENSFGAKLRLPYECEVRHIEKTTFRLVSLDVDDDS